MGVQSLFISTFSTLPQKLTPKLFQNANSFLLFSSYLILAQVSLLLLLEFAFDPDATTSNMSPILSFFSSLFIPNSIHLAIFNFSPVKNSNFFSKFPFRVVLPSFLMVSMLIRVSLSFSLLSDSSALDFELFPLCLSILPLYTILILLSPSALFRVSLLSFHQIATLSYLNIRWSIDLGSNLRIIISILASIGVFWKAPCLGPQAKTRTIPSPELRPSKSDSIYNPNKDWKGLVGDIPIGILMISPKKKILFSNDCSMGLLELDVCSGSTNEFYYQNIVRKFGVLEEIEYLSDNPEQVKPGFKINESVYHSMKDSKKTYLGVNPVNIISSQTLRPQVVISNQGARNSIIGFSPKVSIREKIKDKMATFGMMATGVQDSSPKYKKECSQVNTVSPKFVGGTRNLEEGDQVIRRRSSMDVLGERKMDLDKVIDTMIKHPSKTFKVYFSETSAENKKKLELKIKQISFEDSEVLLLTFQDVSYLELLQQFCDNNEYKNKVLTTLSHELRTPLNGALIPLEKLLSEKLDKPAVVYENLETAYKSMILLQNVLNDVVDFALINSNQLYLNYDEMDIYKFLEDTVELFRKQAHEKGLFMDLHMNKIPHIWKVDYQRLGQILVSLLNNSLKNTFEGGIALHVSLVERQTPSKAKFNPSKNCLKITVEDTGVGIDAEKMENIQRCLQSKDIVQVCGSLNKAHGCGLGLIISHCLAILLGPADSNGLQVGSQVHSGTEFSFQLEAFPEREDGGGDSVNLSMVEEKSREFSRSSIRFKNSSKHLGSVSSMGKNSSKFIKSISSIGDFRNMRKEKEFHKRIEESLSNRTEDIINSGGMSKERGANCGSERTSTGIISFLQNHIMLPRKMTDMEIVSEEDRIVGDVLIVDDDSFNLMALEAILGKFKLNSVRAFNGQQAVDKILERHQKTERKQVFSLIFLDYHMPIKNGLETTQEINKMFKEEGLVEFPIVACTAFGAKDLVEEWSQAGISDFVVKPVSFKKVEGILRKFELLK